MSDPLHNQKRDTSISWVVERHGLTIRPQPTALELVAVITGPDQHPEIVLAANREAVLAMAHLWITTRLRLVRKTDDLVPNSTGSRQL